MEEMTFKQSLDRLEMIVSKLERNEIELEEAMKMFEEGLTLIKKCDNQLSGFENRVQALLDTYQKEGE